MLRDHDVAVVTFFMNKEKALRNSFPEFSEDELESVAQYFDVVVEIAAQDSICGEVGFDIAPPISTLKERSNSNLKDQS